MEELIGTQKPTHRIPDPAQAIATLEGVVPGLVALRREEPAVFGWEAAEVAVGTRLPSDFKALAEWYPAFELDDFLGVFVPRPGEWLDLAPTVTRAEELITTAPEDAPRG
ncbi:hypothetical protein [Streptomyces sp. NPDC005435]|uniref:hypothetical protein n=1 Tax=Streptomyces sp. NPDC005435 TaxID=3154464 RepID=UPI003451905D